MVTYYKLMNYEMNHNEFQYVEGLNIDTKEFNKEIFCNNGLYFTTMEYLHTWLNYRKDLHWIAEVEIPEGAQVFFDENKYKADRIIIKNVIPISDFMENEEFCLAAVKYDGTSLKYVKNQDKEICLIAINENGLSLEYVNDQDDEICLEAVRRNGWALKYVKKSK